MHCSVRTVGDVSCTGHCIQRVPEKTVTWGANVCFYSFFLFTVPFCINSLENQHTCIQVCTQKYTGHSLQAVHPLQCSQFKLVGFPKDAPHSQPTKTIHRVRNVPDGGQHFWMNQGVHFFTRHLCWHVEQVDQRISKNSAIH